MTFREWFDEFWDMVRMIGRRDLRVGTGMVAGSRYVISRLKCGHETFASLPRQGRRAFLACVRQILAENLADYRMVMSRGDGHIPFNDCRDCGRIHGHEKWCPS